MKKKKNLSDKITEHTSDIIFGILSGSGLFLLISGIITMIILILPILQSYSLIIYISLYLFVLISTSVYFTKGWFRIIYLTCASIWLLVYIQVKIFGTW